MEGHAPRFREELSRTYRAAGSPTLKKLVARGGRRYALFHEAGDPAGLADALRHIGDTWCGLGRPELAETAYQTAVTYYRMVNDTAGAAAVLGSLGTTHAALGHLEEAIESLMTATDYAALNRDVGGHIIGLFNLGLAFYSAGRSRESMEHLRAAERQARMFLYHEHLLGTVLLRLGLVLQGRGRLRAAYTAFAESVDVFRELGDAKRLAEAERTLTRLHRIMERRRLRRKRRR
ncbi:tetratricopeptide repeat protein [Streptomyces sp. NPDC050535]|uniref:tetratricopeptide repeat protein n=1 Tax=Streptomyces sp. NPDC050535 TaxID=3365626 RepID=UPI0037A77A57